MDNAFGGMFTNIQIICNQIKAFTQELGISILENIAKLPFADSLFPNLNETLEGLKTKHSETIDYIQRKEKEWENIGKQSNEQYKLDKEQTLDSVKNTADVKTKEMSDVMSTNTKAGSDSVTQNINTMKSEVEKGLGGLSNIALTSTGEIPKATKQNIDNSISTIRNSATGLQDACRVAFQSIYNVAKNQFTNMNNVARTEFTTLSNIIKNQSLNSYNSIKTNFVNACNVVRNQLVNIRNICSNQSASSYSIVNSNFKNMRNSVTQSMISMRKSVESTWGSIRNTLSKGITGKVTVNRVTTNTTKKEPKLVSAPLNNLVDRVNTMSRVNLDSMTYQANAYQPQVIANGSNYNNQDSYYNKRLDTMENKFDSLMSMLGEFISVSSNKDINVNMNVDGRQIAKASARYMESEINMINSRKNRLAGA